MANRLDYILIMTYDAVTYSSSVTGPNFVRLSSLDHYFFAVSRTSFLQLTLFDLQAYSSDCAPSDQTYSIPSAVQAWISAGFPANKVRLRFVVFSFRLFRSSYDDTVLTLTILEVLDHARLDYVRLRLGRTSPFQSLLNIETRY
jgi:hypothetical protein